MRRGKNATYEDIARLKDVEDIPYRRILFSKIPNHLKPEYEQAEVLKSCSTLMDLLEIRDKYIFYDTQILQHPLDVSLRGVNHAPVICQLSAENLTWKMVNGVIEYYVDDAKVYSPVIPVREFYSDLQLLLKSMYDVVNKGFCHTRLKLLQSKFNLHLMCNSDREQFHQKFKKTKDFYTIIKVDNHVHLSAACMQITKLFTDLTDST